MTILRLTCEHLERYIFIQMILTTKFLIFDLKVIKNLKMKWSLQAESWNNPMLTSGDTAHKMILIGNEKPTKIVFWSLFIDYCLVFHWLFQILLNVPGRMEASLGILPYFGQVQAYLCLIKAIQNQSLHFFFLRCQSTCKSSEWSIDQF